MTTILYRNRLIQQKNLYFHRNSTVSFHIYKMVQKLSRWKLSRFSKFIVSKVFEPLCIVDIFICPMLFFGNSSEKYQNKLCDFQTSWVLVRWLSLGKKYKLGFEIETSVHLLFPNLSVCKKRLIWVKNWRFRAKLDNFVTSDNFSLKKNGQIVHDICQIIGNWKKLENLVSYQSLYLNLTVAFHHHYWISLTTIEILIRILLFSPHFWCK